MASASQARPIHQAAAVAAAQTEATLLVFRLVALVATASATPLQVVQSLMQAAAVVERLLQAEPEVRAAVVQAVAVLERERTGPLTQAAAVVAATTATAVMAVLV